MDRNYKKGFTLIELLVVIAIIGILSAVVLASLNQARTRAANASVQSNLKTIQVQAQMYYEDEDGGNQTYGDDETTCSTDLFAEETVALAIATAAESGNSTSTCYVSEDGQEWAASVGFKATEDGSWCVDSTGHAGPGVAVVGGTCDSDEGEEE